MSELRAPFPWFGGKRRVAPVVWRAFGNVTNYVEPFAGSLAVLLGRPGGPVGTETVNDLDCLLANFWRAVSCDPEEVARWADWPVNEADLHARHAWLVARKPALRARIEADPDFYDAKTAGWWVWGCCSWIGSGFCGGSGPWVSDGEGLHLGNRGMGINKQLPHLGNRGMGINKQLPHLGDRGRGIFDWFCRLEARLRDVRVVCGDWSRVLTPSVTERLGVCGVFLDPPYPTDTAGGELYAEGTASVAGAVAAWARENGNNPALRIALCGYEGEHDLPGWRVHKWKAAGGYANSEKAIGNAARERIWFSPHCKGEPTQLGLLGAT